MAVSKKSKAQTKSKKQGPPEFTVKMVPVGQLRPYPGNPRVNDHAVKRMAAAIEELGFRVPVLARSDGEVVDGHLRLKAAQHLGMTHVPVSLVDDLSEMQIKALRLEINKSAEWADWDMPALAEELRAIEEMGGSMTMAGFLEGELKDMFAKLDAQVGTPVAFTAFGEDLETKHTCPKCGYTWS